MKLLIVEDNLSLAHTIADFLHALDGPPQAFEAITLAEDLQAAILPPPEYHAVLCDGMSPLYPNSRFVVEDWDVVHREACRRGIRFVLQGLGACTGLRPRAQHHRHLPAHTD